MGQSRTEKRTLATKLTKLRDLQQHWRSGAPPGFVNPGPVFKPPTSIQGASLSGEPMTLLSLLLALLERQITRHQPWE